MTGNGLGIAVVMILTAAWFTAWFAFSEEKGKHMTTIWTKGFLIALLERILVTFVVTLAGMLTADGFDVLHASWKAILIAAAIATFYSLVKGVSANAITKNGPSLTSSEQTVPPEPQPVGGPGPDGPVG